MISLNDCLSFSHVKIKALSLPRSCKRSLFLLKRLASSISWIEVEWGSTGSTLTELTASDKAWFSNHWYSPGPFGTLMKRNKQDFENGLSVFTKWTTFVHNGRFFSSSRDVSCKRRFAYHSSYLSCSCLTSRLIGHCMELLFVNSSPISADASPCIMQTFCGEGFVSASSVGSPASECTVEDKASMLSIK